MGQQKLLGGYSLAAGMSKQNLGVHEGRTRDNNTQRWNYIPQWLLKDLRVSHFHLHNANLRSTD